MLVEIASSDFPKLREPLISKGTRVKRSHHIGISAFGISGGKSLILFEIATGDFPIQLKPLIRTGTLGDGSEGVRIQGFARSVTLCLRGREFPNRDSPIARVKEVTWLSGTTCVSGIHVASGFRSSRLGRSYETVRRKSRIPDRRFPEFHRCVGPRVGSEDTGHRDLGRGDLRGE